MDFMFRYFSPFNMYEVVLDAIQKKSCREDHRVKDGVNVLREDILTMFCNATEVIVFASGAQGYCQYPFAVARLMQQIMAIDGSKIERVTIVACHKYRRMSKHEVKRRAAAAGRKSKNKVWLSRSWMDAYDTRSRWNKEEHEIWEKWTMQFNVADSSDGDKEDRMVLMRK